ncbi:MAG TPA: zf-HC2 domain-containing protein [Bryobacteraceae bacterium]|nr:zf-HC2 domain-containing protein [Bryobacteraceae bacterium]
MTHPSESILALYAGGDLGWLARRRTERHLARCGECRGEVQGFLAVTDNLIQSNALPVIPWSRMAAEMRANIRLGLAAGECVRSEPLSGPLAWMSNVRTLAACASIFAVVVAGTFLERPSPPSPPVAARTGAILRATADGIELNQGGETLSLLHARTGEVTYSAGAQGSMRAGYVDSDTGNVTINDVYVQ